VIPSEAIIMMHAASMGATVVRQHAQTAMDRLVHLTPSTHVKIQGCLKIFHRPPLRLQLSHVTNHAKNVRLGHAEFVGVVNIY
jgi:hypothetical protein